MSARPNDVLPISLEAMVPIRIAEMRRWSPDARIAAGRAAADVVAVHGDDLQFGGRHCAKTWAALVTGLAALAYRPGGVTAFGRHWCTDHAACVAAEREAGAA